MTEKDKASESFYRRLELVGILLVVAMVVVKFMATFRQLGAIQSMYYEGQRVPKIGESGKPLLDDANDVGSTN